MSKVVWQGFLVPKRYESQWLGRTSGKWWTLGYHRFKWTAVVRASMTVHGAGRVIDHGKGGA